MAAAVAAALAGGGCALEPAKEFTPRMPQMLPVPPTPPKPVVPVADVLAQAVERAGRDDLTGAVNLVEGLPFEARQGVARDLATALTRVDVWQGGRLAAALPPGYLQDAAMEIVVPAMVARDRDATLRWVLAAPDAMKGFASGRVLADQLASGDVRAALEGVLALPETPARHNLLALIAGRWARRDAPAALTWARGLAEGEPRHRALTSIGFEIAQKTPERAVEVAELLPDDRDRWLVQAAIARSWVNRDAVAATTWARQLPAGEARKAALAGIEMGLGGGRLVRDDLNYNYSIINAPAVGTVSGFPRDPTMMLPGLDRDQLVKQQFEDALRASPRRAADLLGSLPVPDRHDELLQRLTREWFISDPAALKTWLELNVPSPAQRELLLLQAGH